jgi:hypothetical protein
MAEQIIDRLVSSLAAGLIGTEEFISAIEDHVGTMQSSPDKPAQAGSGARPAER